LVWLCQRFASQKIANQPEHNSETKLGAKMRERQIHNESTPFERHYP
jgi:hypothetical protein